jgi:hypothetical protein
MVSVTKTTRHLLEIYPTLIELLRCGASLMENPPYTSGSASSQAFSRKALFAAQVMKAYRFAVGMKASWSAVAG